MTAFLLLTSCFVGNHQHGHFIIPQLETLAARELPPGFNNAFEVKSCKWQRALRLNATRPILIFCVLIFARIVSVHADLAGDKLGTRALKQAILTNYSEIMSQSYKDSANAARTLAKAIDVLVNEPSEQSLAAARQAWLAARIPYLQTEAARFYDGPIDQVEGRINAWPIDESYIDYVEDKPEAGVINMTKEFPAISEELLLSLNEKEGRKNISCGYHAIEFLLWGQDFDKDGPGHRPWTDYGADGKNAGRRKQYLQLTAKLLVENLQTVAAEWNINSTTNFRAAFVTSNPDKSLAKILRGAGAFSSPELAGERLTAPYETKDQENEQSCFSDNTHNDIIYDAIGIQNVYLGRYTASDGQTLCGPGIHDLLMQHDPALASALAAQMEKSIALARRIPIPFDQAIVGATGAPGRVAIKATITSVQAQSDMIAKAAEILGLNLEQ